MTSHGFTVIHHISNIQDREGCHDPQTLEKVCYPEIEDLVKRVTGCTTVSVTNSKCRTAVPLEDLSKSNAWKTGHKDIGEAKIEAVTKAWHKRTPLGPIPILHCDSNTLGGRQSVRRWMTELRDSEQAWYPAT